VPRLAGKDSLHPGNGGNIAFGSQDLDNTMRLVFYPASIGWILLGVWIATLVTRTAFIEDKLYSK
jgi:heme exporter protein C